MSRFANLSDWLRPILGVIAMMALFAALVVAGHRDDLDEALSRHQAGAPARLRPTFLECVRLAGRDPGAALAGLLVPPGDPAVSRLLRIAAYRALLRLRPPADTADALFALSPVALSGGSVVGLGAAARKGYGVAAEGLSIGEIALLCDAAFGSHPLTEDPRSLRRRNALLARLHERGYLSADAFAAETARPLSLFPRPEPVR